MVGPRHRCYHLPGDKEQSLRLASAAWPGDFWGSIVSCRNAAIAPTTRREITPAELFKQRIEKRAKVPFAVWDGRVRMSIAGYQDKLSVYIDEARMYLVEGELASTHILKPEPADGRLPMLVENGHYCMSLGKRLGFPVAPVSILRVPEPVLVVERFDRAREAERVRRLHIIDGCRLSTSRTHTNTSETSVPCVTFETSKRCEFERLFPITEYTVEKAVTRMGLLRWAMFQYLIGNCDAHGKNVSFFCKPAGLSLAPSYDLVSVVQYDGLDHRLAMAYGDKFGSTTFAHMIGPSLPSGPRFHARCSLARCGGSAR